MAVSVDDAAPTAGFTHDLCVLRRIGQSACSATDRSAPPARQTAGVFAIAYAPSTASEGNDARHEARAQAVTVPDSSPTRASVAAGTPTRVFRAESAARPVATVWMLIGEVRWRHRISGRGSYGRARVVSAVGHDQHRLCKETCVTRRPHTCGRSATRRSRHRRRPCRCQAAPADRPGRLASLSSIDRHLGAVRHDSGSESMHESPDAVALGRGQHCCP
jgi:hypothetical protein